MDLLAQPPLPANPPLPPNPGPPNGYGQHERPQQQQQKRKKRGKRGSGLGPNSRPFKQQQRAPQQLGFFGQVPNLQDLRQENWRRTQQHFAGPPRGGFQQGPGPSQQQQQHGRRRLPAAALLPLPAHLALGHTAPLFLAERRPMPLRASCRPQYGTGRHRRPRSKGAKQPKFKPRPVPLTPASE